MIAITTKYLAPTNTKGARIKAKGGYYSVTIPFDYSKSDVELHYTAVKALMEKHELDYDISKMTYGSSDHGNTYHFCFPHSLIEA
jgi:hypothetical protein